MDNGQRGPDVRDRFLVRVLDRVARVWDTFDQRYLVGEWRIPAELDIVRDLARVLNGEERFRDTSCSTAADSGDLRS